MRNVGFAWCNLRYELPQDHGLPLASLVNALLLPRNAAGEPSITEVQFQALAAGVGRGSSMLCVAPTSTGKTLVGVWALLTWLNEGYGRRAVYLVTHRALARQKFDELLNLLREQLFGGDPTCVVLANGDTVEDGMGVIPSAPLEAPLLVATYEKYLAMLASSGVRGDMTDCAVICDEVQILGDATRGRTIEVLLTLLRRARWGQLVALSAVLDLKDASAVADWLNISLIRCSLREKHLIYECRTESGLHTFNTAEPVLGVRTRRRVADETLHRVTAVLDLIKNAENCPVVVFCMSRERVYKLAAELAGEPPPASNVGQALLPGFGEDTTAARELTFFMQKRIAFHTADLREDERRAVENALAQKQIDVVVATSTLAAGVNFPLGTVVFDRWERWDGERRAHVPLPESEFQNMAGRAGRMGYDHELGRVVFFAEGNAFQQRPAIAYLNPDRVTSLKPRLGPAAFSQVALQLLSAGFCQTDEEVHQFLLETLSAFRERDVNRAGLAHWQQGVSAAVQSLRDWGYVL